MSGHDPLLHPVDRVIADLVRKVAIHRGAVGAAQLRRQVDHAVTSRDHFVVTLRNAGHVRVGECQVVDHQAAPAWRLVPAAAPAQAVEGECRLSEYSRQAQPQLRRIDLERAATGVALDLPGEIGQPRLVVDRRHAQPAEAGRNAEIVETRLRSVPAQPQGVEAALRLQRLQPRTQGGVHRQARQDGLPAAQAERPGRDLAPRGAPAETDIEGCAQGAALLRHAQVFEGDALAAGVALPDGLAAHLRQPQRRQAFAERGFDRAQIHAGRHAGERAARHPECQRQRPPTPARLIGQRQPMGEARKRDACHRRVDGAVPGPDVVRVAAVEAGFDRQRPRQPGRRDRAQLQAMGTARVGEQEIDVLQDERRRVAHFVQPGQRGRAHVHPALPQQPAGEAAGGIGRVDGDAPDVEMAVARAPHAERQALQFDAVEARLEEQQRTPGERGFEFGEVERRPALRVVQAHAAQAELGARLLPHTRHGLERHALAERARHQVRHRVAMIGNIRQHPEEHQRRCGREAQCAQRSQGGQPARGAAQEHGKRRGNGHE